MSWKEKLSNCGLLYVLLDYAVIKEARLDIVGLAEEIAASSCDLIQLRAKSTPSEELLPIATRLTKAIHNHKKLFIINDSAELTLNCGADGLHIGVGDISVAEARKIIGNLIIGKTVHSLKELKLFENEDIDYVSIGPVFKTQTKPELAGLGLQKIKEISSASHKLTFAIGGINLYNIGSLAENKVTNVAITRGIILSKNIRKAIDVYKKLLKKHC